MRLFFLSLGFLSITCLYGQSVSKISGTITEESTNSPVIEAKVFLIKSNAIFKKVLTDVGGNYAFTDVPFGQYELEIVSIAYDTIRVDINVKSTALRQNFTLGENRELEEIKVIGNIVTGQNVPVAITKIPLQKITEELASRDL
ncbi:MAG: beta-sandwich domain-containing protein, partial [Crocinitomicaceae bacterium]